MSDDQRGVKKGPGSGGGARWTDNGQLCGYMSKGERAAGMGE